MEYSFTDWDNREYKRKTKEKIVVHSERFQEKNIILKISESNKEVIKFIFSHKEAKAILLALNASSYDLKSTIEVDF